MLSTSESLRGFVAHVVSLRLGFGDIARTGKIGDVLADFPSSISLRACSICSADRVGPGSWRWLAHDGFLGLPLDFHPAVPGKHLPGDVTGNFHDGLVPGPTFSLGPQYRRMPVLPTGHCPVPVLSRTAKTSFPEARTTSLRSVVLSRLGS